MTSSVTHVFRLLRWGRTLARHGALTGIERDRATPAPVRRLARIARFGARVPKKPRYTEAFVAIGPAAIKLGQALATRADLVGDEAAIELQTLQDRLPQEGADEDLGQVRQIVAGRDQSGAIVQLDAVDPLQRHHPLGGAAPVDLGNVEIGLGDHILAQF